MPTIPIKLTVLVRTSPDDDQAAPPPAEAEYSIDLELLERPEQPRLTLLEDDRKIVTIPIADATPHGSPIIDAIQRALGSGATVILELRPDAQ